MKIIDKVLTVEVKVFYVDPFLTIFLLKWLKNKRKFSVWCGPGSASAYIGRCNAAFMVTIVHYSRTRYSSVVTYYCHTI